MTINLRDGGDRDCRRIPQAPEERNTSSRSCYPEAPTVLRAIPRSVHTHYAATRPECGGSGRIAAPGRWSAAGRDATGAVAWPEPDGGPGLRHRARRRLRLTAARGARAARARPSRQHVPGHHWAGASAGRSVMTMANIPSTSRAGTERVIIQISPPPASK